MKMRSFSLWMLVMAVGMIAIVSTDFYAQAVGASRGLPADGSYTVTGKVVLPDGTPAVGSRVDVSCDFTNRSASTGSDGSYLVTGIPAGNCTIVATVKGFEPLTERRQIQRDTPYGQGIYIPFFIRANPYSSTNPLFKDVPKPAVENYKTATEKLNKGDAAGALPLLEKAIAAHPTFAAAWYQKGVALNKQNEKQKAVEAFVKAIELKPDYVEAKYAFGMAQLDLKNYEVSEAVFRDVLKENNMPEAHLNLGISLFYQKKADEAESELKSVIANKSGERFALAHLYLGQIYVQKKKNAEAAGELQKYVDLVPKAPNAERIRTVIADLKKQT